MLHLDTDLLRRKAQAAGDHDFQKMANRAGINRHAVSRVFAGKVPTLPNVVALARAYGIPLDELITAREETGPDAGAQADGVAA